MVLFQLRLGAFRIKLNHERLFAMDEASIKRLIDQVDRTIGLLPTSSRQWSEIAGNVKSLVGASEGIKADAMKLPNPWLGENIQDALTKLVKIKLDCFPAPNQDFMATIVNLALALERLRLAFVEALNAPVFKHPWSRKLKRERFIQLFGQAPDRAKRLMTVKESCEHGYWYVYLDDRVPEPHRTNLKPHDGSH